MIHYERFIHTKRCLCYLYFSDRCTTKAIISTRGTITVFYGDDKTRPLLTVDDKNINKEFPGKSP